MRFRKKPIEIEAISWVGNNLPEVVKFCGLHWTRADAIAIPWPSEFRDDDYQGVLYNALEACWIPCPKGHWIVRGVKGELYPVEPNVFWMTYERAE